MTFFLYTLTGWVMVTVMTSSLEVPNEPACTASPAPQAQEAVPRSVVQDESLCMRWGLITELGAVELVRSMSEARDN